MKTVHLCILYVMLISPAIMGQAFSSDSLNKFQEEASINNPVHVLYEHLLAAQQSKDSIAISNLLLQISIQYSTNKNIQRAQILADEGLNNAYALGIDSLIASGLNAKAIALRAYVVQENREERITPERFLSLADSVIKIYQQKLVVLENENLPHYDAYTYQGIGQMYLRMANIDSTYIDHALHNFEKATEISKHRTDDVLLTFRNALWLAVSHNRQKEYEESISLLQEITPLLQNPAINLPAKQMFYGVYLNAHLKHMNRSDLALLFHQYRLISDNILNTQFSNLTASMDRQFETNKTKNELAQQEEINQLQQAQIDQRNLILGILGLLFLSAGGGGIFFFRLNRKNQQLAENNALLVKEQNHRVKNNLQMISSLLSLQANRTEGASKEHILDGSRRVQAIGLLHRKLYDDLNGLKEVNLKSYIEELVEDILYATNQPNIPIKLTLKDVSIPVEKAIHLALILNELITNSIKHVFSKGKLNGECVNILLSLHHESYQLKYKDHGGNFDLQKFKHSDSLGHQIIHSQSRYVGTNYSVTNDHGFCYQLIFEVH